MDPLSSTILEYKKVFQNYFTQHLFQSKPLNKVEKFMESKNKHKLLDDDYSIMFNKLFHKTSEEIWKTILSRFCPDVQTNREKWEKCFHFFLKGEKSYYLRLLSFLKNKESNIQFSDSQSKYFKELDQDIDYVLTSFNDEEKSYDYGLVDKVLDSEMEQPPNLAYVLAEELKKFSYDSDFDFTFCVNPENYAYTEDVPTLLKDCIISGVVFCERESEKLKTYFDDYLKVINHQKNQESLFKSLQHILPLIKEQREAKLVKILQEHIENKKYFNFRFNSKFPIKFISSNQPIINNSIYLYRIVIDIKSGIKELDKSNFFSLFAEGIDITYSLENEEEIWSKSSAEFMNKPIPLVSEQSDTQYNYPIANLSYLIQDTLVVFYNQIPSKPELRCQRFMQQLYLSCLDQNLKLFPETLQISNKMWNIILQSNINCKKLLEFFTFIKQDENFTTVKVDKKLRNIDEFESWCFNENFPFSKIEEYRFIYKTKIIESIINNYKFFLDLKNKSNIEKDGLDSNETESRFVDICKKAFKKDKLISYLHQLEFLKQLVTIWLSITKPQYLNTNFYEVYVDPNTQASIQEKNSEVIEVVKYVIEKLNLEPHTNVLISIQNNPRLNQTNFFARTISKFVFRPL